MVEENKREQAVEALAKILHAELEHLDPTEDPKWEDLTEHQKDIYRCCVWRLVRERKLIGIATEPF
jgi:hypothetical protein